MSFRRIATLVLIGALIAPFGMSVAASATTYPGLNGTIAFTKKSNNVENIWLMRSNGAEQRPLTRNGSTSPVWSPDGKQLVFVDTQTKRLSVADSSGKSIRNLTRAYNTREHSPAWSKDGQQIAFIREEQYKNQTRNAIFVAAADGARQTRVTGWSHDVRFQSPSWSADGQNIVYGEASDSQARLVIAHLPDHSKRQLTILSDTSMPIRVSWSPTGKILYTDSTTETYTIWPDGSHRATIADGDSHHAAWSPNGTRIAFLEATSGEGISISGADGTVTNIPIEQGHYDAIGAPVWSPDGKRLLFTMTDITNSKSTTDLFSLDITNTASAPVKRASNTGAAYSWQAKPLN